MLSYDANAKRYRFIPRYPIPSYGGEPLLTNVPTDELDDDQLAQRETFGYYLSLDNPTTPESSESKWLTTLSQTWNIRRNVLVFNMRKILQIIDQLAFKRMHHFSAIPDDEVLFENEYEIALEFFLQLDYDLFYMKTCSYGGAQPIDNEPRSIFSTNRRPPYGRYTMDSCHRKSCSLCYPSIMIDSQGTTQHWFANGYRSILNCPATCRTKNIIYVLRCPCDEFDYVGETSLSLQQRLTYHRQHANRIIKEFLLGKKLTDYINNGVIKTHEALVKDRMKLYRHLYQCPVAMRYFLKENPDYWLFVPQKLTPQEEYEQERELKSTDDIQQYEFANDVPVPINTNYHFPKEQKQEIDKFFQQKKYLTTPNLDLNLYLAKIIAVLPENTSGACRRFIECLFITQAETKLNTFGHLDRDDEPSTDHLEPTNEFFYEYLNRPNT